MKIKLLFTLFITAFTLSVSGQYKPMLDHSSWNIRIYGFTGFQDLVIPEGTNVVIGAYTYTKFHDPFFDNDVYLREDIAAKRVYRYVNGTDELLYDFSLTDGSTITMPNGYTYNVTVYTVNVVGGTRKCISLSTDFFSGGTWVEGVGNREHPLVPSYELMSDPAIILTCSAQNGNAVYNNGIANGGSATDCSMLLGTDALQKNETAVAPNPFTSEFRITTNTPLVHATLKVFNIYGQLVREIDGINGQAVSFERNDLAAGVYVMQLLQNDKVIYHQKVVAAP